MMGAVRVRNTELEGSGDEVLQGETHNLSQFAVGAPCFVTDVMMYRCIFFHEILFFPHRIDGVALSAQVRMQNKGTFFCEMFVQNESFKPNF